MIRSLIMAIAALFIITACGGNTEFVEPANQSFEDDSPTDENVEDPQIEVEKLSFITMDWDGAHREAPLWNVYLYLALSSTNKDLINKRPNDVLDFCPRYDDLGDEQRKMFWIHLISVMARFESNFDPNTAYEEDFVDSKGKKVVSRGLLQISDESSRGYGCNQRLAEELHESQKNLVCGLKIMSHWVNADKVISELKNNKWRGGARYWAVLRTYSGRDLVKQVKERTRQSEVCREQDQIFTKFE
ncbi:MAG: hypothetical protein KDD33_08830 [Bdellovibrionales bacterium]|nr:hypothetical protein [Bdellovibrionales bacterium]